VVMAWIVIIASALTYLEPASLAFAVSFPARSAHSDALSFSVHARPPLFLGLFCRTCVMAVCALTCDIRAMLYRTFYFSLFFLMCY